MQSALWAKFGGAEGIAELLYEEFQNAKEGSPFRSKVLDLMTGLATKNLDDEQADLSEYSEQELMSLLEECLREE